HVEYHQVRFEPRHRRERVAPGADGLDGKALKAQGHRHDLDEARLVIDDEHAMAGRILNHALVPPHSSPSPARAGPRALGRFRPGDRARPAVEGKRSANLGAHAALSSWETWILRSIPRPRASFL